MTSKINFSELIATSDKPVLVDFYATWCAPCKILSPIVEEVAREMGDKLKVIKVDVDKNQNASMHYKIQGVPTLVLFDHGQIKWRQSGVMSKRDLMSQLSSAISAKV